MKTVALHQPTEILFTLLSRLKALRPLSDQLLSMPVWYLIGTGKPIRKTLLYLAIIPLIVVMFALGIAISQIAHQRIENEEGMRLQSEASYFVEHINQTIERHLIDLQSRAALLPKFNLHDGNPQLAIWMSTVHDHITDYSWIGFASDDGTIQVSTSPETAGMNVGRTAWFQEGLLRSGVVNLLAGSPTRSLAAQPTVSESRVIQLVTPVRDESGRVTGVLSGHLGWDWLQRQHERFTASLARDLRPEIIIVSLNGEARSISQDRHAASLHELASFQLARAGQSGWRREVWPDKKEYLVGYAPSFSQRDRYGLGWTMLIRLPLDSVYQLIHPVLQGLWILIGATIIGFILMAKLLLRVTLRPIEQLVSNINTVTEHGGRVHLTTPVPLEFQVLSRATNRMIDAVKTREAAEQAKSRLIADMSHEIRTPLHGLIGHAELLRARLSDVQDQRDVSCLIRCAKEMTELVNDALDLSTTEIRPLKLDERPVVLQELIEFNCDIFRSVAARKGLLFQLETRFDPSLCVLADRLRLGQILRNLFSNAVKFTNQGSVRVIASVSEAEPAGHHLNRSAGDNIRLTLEVIDSGIGIPHDQQPLLFQRFHQVPDTNADQHHGTGLGLSVTKALIESMNGSIALQSAPQRGTQVCVALPLARATVEPQRDLTLSIPAPNCELRILVVDDSEQNRDVMARWLLLHGQCVTTASTAQAAIEHAEQQVFDLILLDINLPDRSGRDAAKIIRASSHPNARATIAAISGFASEEDRQKSVASGINRHFNKPVDFNVLRDYLAEIPRNTLLSE